MTKERDINLPPPWDDYHIQNLDEWPESVTDRPEVLDEGFKDLTNIFQGLGVQVFENMVGRTDVHLCNVCGIMFFPENPTIQCPLCSLLHWIVAQQTGQTAKISVKGSKGADSEDFMSLLDKEISNAELLKQWDNKILTK